MPPELHQPLVGLRGLGVEAVRASRGANEDRQLNGLATFLQPPQHAHLLLRQEREGPATPDGGRGPTRDHTRRRLQLVLVAEAVVDQPVVAPHLDLGALAHDAEARHAILDLVALEHGVAVRGDQDAGASVVVDNVAVHPRRAAHEHEAVLSDAEKLIVLNTAFAINQHDAPARRRESAPDNLRSAPGCVDADAPATGRLDGAADDCGLAPGDALEMHLNGSAAAAALGVVDDLQVQIPHHGLAGSLAFEAQHRHTGGSERRLPPPLPLEQ
mmetsp:Transcript_86760/g.226467  ORF Transcript_86760/g.226467 Transcript_86760/m.226467 type:complete len:271 (+) Transcript_86760:322-1134(+)